MTSIHENSAALMKTSHLPSPPPEAHEQSNPSPLGIVNTKAPIESIVERTCDTEHNSLDHDTVTLHPRKAAEGLILAGGANAHPYDHNHGSPNSSQVLARTPSSGAIDTFPLFQAPTNRSRQSSITKSPIIPNRSRKLSSEQITQLASVPLSPRLTAALTSPIVPLTAPIPTIDESFDVSKSRDHSGDDYYRRTQVRARMRMESPRRRNPLDDLNEVNGTRQLQVKHDNRPGLGRTVSTPPLLGRKKSHSKHDRTVHSRRRYSPAPLDLSNMKSSAEASGPKPTTPVDSSRQLPLPPLSIPTYLQLELNADRGVQPDDDIYESSAIKFERLRNFLILPPFLEHLLWFGIAACLDAWLYNFTILPLRFFKALGILSRWWVFNIWKEAKDLVEFVYLGSGRLWRRRRARAKDGESVPPSREHSRTRAPSQANGAARPSESNGILKAWPEPLTRKQLNSRYRHRRTRSTPSLLSPSHKADLLKGLLVIASSFCLLYFDPSRMYHNIRGQAAIKLYVIYNVLEVGDRLLSALGQDVLECLFSREVLERGPDGRSHVIRPAWVFLVALAYNVIHAAALLYQVITLNVAVNSYSNALLTLLLSNQFVEIKGAVFKKVEKENLFQMTCADVAERFQLWLMLLIIAMRNMVEVGGISISISNSFDSTAAGLNSTTTSSTPFSASSILPKSFTMFTMLPKFTGQVLGPFMIVLGSEMVVDWIKHAYVNKFNDTKPIIYSRFLDIMAKDYYTNAFGDQNLTKRIGLPVLPLSCLFVRTVIQTYHMFLATHMPLPLPSTAKSLQNSPAESSSPATTAALAHVDSLFRRALGRTGFAGGVESAAPPAASWLSRVAPFLPKALTSITLDDFFATILLVVVVVVIYLLLLASKLVLGAVLLQWSRRRYSAMIERDNAQPSGASSSLHTTTSVGSRRLGATGMVEIDEDRRRRIYEDDAAGLGKLKEKEERGRRERDKKAMTDLARVERYAMVAKRIW